MLNYTGVILSLFVVFAAAIIQGITGFGFALLAVPLLSLFINPIKSVTPMVVIFSLVTNILIIYKSRKHIELKRIYFLIIFGVIGTPLGTYLLLVIKAETLKIIVGLIIIVTAVAMAKDYKIKIKNERISFLIVGMLSGLLNGSTALSGPPVVLFLSNQGVDKDVFRANLSVYAMITNIFAIVMFMLSGVITGGIVKYSFYVLPALIIGTFIGIKIASKIGEEFFKKLTIISIIVLGFITVVNVLIK